MRLKLIKAACLAILLGAVSGLPSLAQTFTPGVVKAEVYTGIGGVTVANLTSNPKYPNSPDRIEYVNILEYPPGDETTPPPNDVYNNYGVRVSGFIIPTETASYVFYMSADDGASFWLSTDATAANLRLLATEPTWNNPRDYTGADRRPGCAGVGGTEPCENVSVPVALTAGTRYYFEAFMKEGGGGDNLSVAWAKDGEAAPVAPITAAFLGTMVPAAPSIVVQPTSRTAPEGGGTVFSVVVDAAGTEAPTFQWLRNGSPITGETGSTLTVNPIVIGDQGAKYSVRVTVGSTTLTSSEATLTVSPKREYAGFLKFEAWNGIGGTALPTSLPNGDYSVLTTAPSFVGYMSAFNTRTVYPNDANDNYVARISGWFIPDVTGDYHFYLRSDDAGQLYVSGDATIPDPNAGAVPVAEEFGCCGGFEPVGAPETTASPIRMTAGQRYGIMALLKEGGGGDWMEVAARIDGATTALTPIPGARLATSGNDLFVTTQPADISIVENRSGSLTVLAGGAAGVTYQWQRAAPGTTTFTDISGATGTTLNITPVFADSGAKYRVVINAAGGQSVTTREATLTVTPDPTPPTIQSVVVAPNRQGVFVTFSEPMAATGLDVAGNYTVSGGATVSSAVAVSSRTVLLNTAAALTAGTQYTLTIGNALRDQASGGGNPVTPNTATFTPPAAAPTPPGTFVNGAVLYERWEGVNSLAALQGEIDVRPPDATELRAAFEHPGFGDSLGNYGARMRAWFTPPQDGIYVFHSASDDASNFFISTDSDPANRKLVAAEPSWNDFRDWSTLDRRNAAAPENRSNTYTGTQWPAGGEVGLKGGQQYYIEIRWAEGGGGDNGAATFRLASEAAPADQTPSRLTGSVIGVYAEGALPPLISKAPTGVTYNRGDTLTFTVEALGTPPLTYQWFKNKLPIPGATSTTLTIPNADARNVGDYSVRVSNASGSSSTFTSDNSARAIMTGAFSIEAEDYNYEGGKHLPVASTMPYTGNAYRGLRPTLDIDFSDFGDESGGAADAYLRTPFSDPGTIETKGPADPPDYNRGSFSVTANYGLGWTDAGDWENYTRTFPKGTYVIIGGVAHDGLGGMAEGEEMEIDMILSKVANPTVADNSTPGDGGTGVEGGAQGLTKLGNFKSPGTGAWSSNDLVPLTDDTGAIVQVPLNGVETLRLTFTRADGDTDFFLLYCMDCPAIQITSPANNATFAEGANVPITVNATASSGTISKVEYFANGAKIGESTTAPFSFTVPNAPRGAYTVYAVATDSEGRAGTSASINVVVGTPDTVLYVHGATATGSDNAIIAGLRQAGMLVVAKTATSSTTADAQGKALIITSSTVGSGDVNTKFRDVAVPVVNWEQALQDDYLMTGNTDGTDRGTATAQTTLDIVTAAHPMAAGLSGTVTVANSATDFSWGLPAAGATRIATVTGDANRVVIYGYDTGATLANGTTAAPARRVMLFLSDNAYANLTAQGQALVEAAIDWALAGGGVTPAPQITGISRSGNQVTITWTGGGELQTAPVVTGGTWTGTGDSDGSYTTTASAAEAYFRVRR